MKKRIGFVLNAPVRYSETFLLQEFRLLEAAGFEVCIFQGGREEKISHPYKSIPALPFKVHGWDDIAHIASALSLLFLAGFIPLLKFIFYEARTGTGPGRIIKRIWFNAHILPHRIDHLHFCFAEVAIQKELSAKAIGATMSVSLRGSDVVIYPEGKKDCYLQLWKYVDKVHAVSEWVYEKAVQLGLDSNKKHSILYDGVDPDHITYNGSDIHSPLRILSVGRLEAVKDHDFALRVIRNLIDHGVDLHLSIVGEGSRKHYLLSRVQELDLEKHVRLTGKLRPEEVFQLMTASDLYMHTSKSEGLGVSLLEAQASGLLTVSLAAGGTEESIEDKKSGWIVRDRDPVAMAKKIIEIVQMPSDERMYVKAYARKRIEERFDIKKFLPRWKEFFED